ncbi:hypothetical protein MMC16_005422 [Acarospora aff. strigata]|nr:hypothetical protein [Acarospora aff. strigata]
MEEVQEMYDGWKKAMAEVTVVLTASRPQEVSSPFPFQKLPPELRNEIYHLHLVQAMKPTRLFKRDDQQRRIIAEAEQEYDSPSDVPCPYQNTALSILGVSRQLHDEALGVFYYHNALQLDNIRDLLAFLKCIGPKRRSYIRDLRFSFYGKGSQTAFAILQNCERLTRLNIGLSCYTMFGAPEGSRSFLKAPGVKSLLKIRGLQSVEFSWKSKWGDEYTSGFEETVREALLQPSKKVKKSRLLEISIGTSSLRSFAGRKKASS